MRGVSPSSRLTTSRSASLASGQMLFMVVEHFRNGDPRPVYQRFGERGRLAPDGLRYVASWVTDDLRRCFQVMECDDRRLLDEWIVQWSDIVEFEVIPVVTSAEASAAVASMSSSGIQGDR